MVAKKLRVIKSDAVGEAAADKAERRGPKSRLTRSAVGLGLDPRGRRKIAFSSRPRLRLYGMGSNDGDEIEMWMMYHIL
jgi:hypothetical protein